MHLNLDFAALRKIVGSAGDCLPAAFVLRRLSSLEHAVEADVAIVIERGDASVFDPIALDKVTQTKAACVVASYDVLPGRTCIVSDALEAYHTIVDFIASRDRKMFFRDERYPHAMISRDAHIEHDVHIDPGVVVMAGAHIGSGSILHAHVYVGVDVVIGQKVILHTGTKVLDRCSIGDASVLHAGAVVGADGFGYQVTAQGLRKIPQVGIVRIGKHVELGANVVVDRAAFDETIIDDGAKLGNLVSISHNVVIGKSCAVLPQTCIGGSTRVGAGCLIGAQVAVKDHVIIGNRAKIVSKSGIMENVEEGKTVAGIPAVSFTDWKRIQVITRQLPVLVKEIQQKALALPWWKVVEKKIISLMKR
ncbi:UDP-3-O-(3-hydroxymyristoyl)glucosamine N-acyltransferase [Candidatus Dependentiae bacterium]|nr:UDP-3-O-(3-hydroxymyristoyl)glucosamine N-acyltransferase [Candidatus Dependentiae bacterium]